MDVIGKVIKDATLEQAMDRRVAIEISGRELLILVGILNGDTDGDDVDMVANYLDVTRTKVNELGITRDTAYKLWDELNDLWEEEFTC